MLATHTPAQAAHRSRRNTKPFAAIPHEIVQDRCLGDLDIRLLCLLLKDAKDRAFSTAKVDDLCEGVHKSRRTVQCHLKGLLFLGILMERDDPESPSGRRLYFEWRYYSPDYLDSAVDREPEDILNRRSGAAGCAPQEPDQMPEASVPIEVAAEVVGGSPGGVVQDESDSDVPPVVPPTASVPNMEVPVYDTTVSLEPEPQVGPEITGVPRHTHPFVCRKIARMRSAREELERLAATDPIIAREFASKAVPLPPSEPPPETLEQALQRLHDPTVPTATIAHMLAVRLRDLKDVSFLFFHKVVDQARKGVILPQAILKAVRHAMSARCPGAYFVRCFK